ncbi:alpha-ketoacid dehydrogenase subunit beta [Bradyrhizobium yuanmingense]|uniref:alpha-ketoacid dehydrogenase subunit beta n=1 Tax=Bradyrhizobium yuanmingense TaxID=108015 RepID=UPI0023BA0D78|nr:transketolase C-terminal domain-containing protein [Bradyrhizobium yuanmingense]MDF0498894.1 transketolase C-terminal domain-containing protein [Bradyrhizobium yuanmingense]
MTKMSYFDAGRLALEEEMRRDATVWAVGEDLGRGGVFGQYRGLAEMFGSDRISDAPISEAAILGVAVGAAMMGTRPVADMRYSDFALCAMDELVNQAAKARFMFGGQARVPLVVRGPLGIAGSAGPQHSQSLEAWYAHVPGLVVVCPATPADNKGLLKSAIRCDDPVVFMEHKGLWNFDGEVPDDAHYTVSLGRARKVSEGKDLTIVSWSKQVHVAAAATQSLARDGISVDLIDLRTLWPWDKVMVFDSVNRTKCLIVAHEAVAVGGFGGEIVATVAEKFGGGVTVRRLGAPRAPVGFAPSVQDAVRVTEDAIGAAAREMVVRKPEKDGA